MQSLGFSNEVTNSFFGNNISLLFCLRADVCWKGTFPRATKEIGDICKQATYSSTCKQMIGIKGKFLRTFHGHYKVEIMHHDD